MSAEHSFNFYDWTNRNYPPDGDIARALKGLPEPKPDVPYRPAWGKYCKAAETRNRNRNRDINTANEKTFVQHVLPAVRHLLDRDSKYNISLHMYLPDLLEESGKVLWVKPETRQYQWLDRDDAREAAVRAMGATKLDSVAAIDYLRQAREQARAKQGAQQTKSKCRPARQRNRSR